MNDIIDKTNKLISIFEESDLIKNLEKYKTKVINNKNILLLITKYNSGDDNEKLLLKKEIFSYEEYSLYMKYYNELFFYILKINNKYKEYNEEKECKK